MQSCNKRLRADGKEASSFWGGATNPDGSLKKIAVYNTKGKKSARRKENEQRRSASKKDLKELFLERREELEKLGRWTGPRTLSVWLQELAVRVLNGEDEAAAAGIPTVLIVVLLLYIDVCVWTEIGDAAYYGGDACCGQCQRPGAHPDCFGPTPQRFPRCRFRNLSNFIGNLNKKRS